MISTDGYPTDADIVAADADFVFASWRSAFREKEAPREAAEDTDGSPGVWKRKHGHAKCPSKAVPQLVRLPKAHLAAQGTELGTPAARPSH